MTPRSRPLVATLVVLLLAVASCGDDAGETASAGGDESTDAGAYPVTVDHAWGSTTLEERPDRIVTVSVQWTDAVLAMGQAPTAYVLDSTSGETDPYPWQADQLDDAERIDTAGTIPFEQIASARPDLILVAFAVTDQATFDTLAEIAPTIGLLGDLEVDPWQDQVEVLGRVLGEADRATEVIDDVEAQVDDLATELPGLEGKTYVAANFVEGDGIYVVADPDDGASRLFYGLGMEIDPEILALDEEAVGRIQISTEQVDVLDADFVGILTNGSDVSALPGWDQLPAVSTGGVVDFELADVIGLNTPTPLSIPYVMEIIRPALEAVAAT